MHYRGAAITSPARGREQIQGVVEEGDDERHNSQDQGRQPPPPDPEWRAEERKGALVRVFSELGPSPS